MKKRFFFSSCLPSSVLCELSLHLVSAREVVSSRARSTESAALTGLSSEERFHGVVLVSSALRETPMQWFLWSVNC